MYRVVRDGSRPLSAASKEVNGLRFQVQIPTAMGGQSSPAPCSFEPAANK